MDAITLLRQGEDASIVADKNLLTTAGKLYQPQKFSILVKVLYRASK